MAEWLLVKRNIVCITCLNEHVFFAKIREQNEVDIHVDAAWIVFIIVYKF